MSDEFLGQQYLFDDPVTPSNHIQPPTQPSAPVRRIRSLVEAKKLVQEGSKQPKGINCPCCGQLCKIYKRTLRADMASWLMWLIREYYRDPRWIHVTECKYDYMLTMGGDYAKLLHWKMIVQKENDDEKKRTSGLWKPTDRGVSFVTGAISVPKQALIFNAKFIGWSDEQITITDALGEKFSYKELMTGIHPYTPVGDV